MEEEPSPPILVSARELARLFSVSPAFIYKLAKQGDIPVVAVGSLMRFDPIDVRRALSVPPYPESFTPPPPRPQDDPDGVVVVADFQHVLSRDQEVNPL